MERKEISTKEENIKDNICSWHSVIHTIRFVIYSISDWKFAKYVLNYSYIFFNPFEKQIFEIVFLMSYWNNSRKTEKGDMQKKVNYTENN